MYQIPELLKYSKLFHAFSDKKDGNMANAILGKVMNFDEVLINRERFLSSVNIRPESCICMWVTGGDGVEIADPQKAGVSIKNYKKAVKTDSLITNQKELYLFLLTADCAPVILYDPEKEVLGLVHVGWRGADLEIVKKTIKKMNDEYGVNSESLVAGIGPSASKESFIKESPSQLNDPKWKFFLEEVGEGKYKVDFVGLCKRQLLDEGVKKENIFESGIDTVKNERFYSHVREGKSNLNQQGRFACVVGLQDQKLINKLSTA